MTWFACCEWRSRFSLTTTRATRKVLLCQWRRDYAHPAAQTFWETDADRREGLSNSTFRPCSAAMTLKDPLNNKLKHVERCQTLLVGENNNKKKKNNAEKGEYPTARERHTADKQMNCRDFFFFFTAVVAQDLKTNFSLFTDFTVYSHIKIIYQPLILSK